MATLTEKALVELDKGEGTSTSERELVRIGRAQTFAMLAIAEAITKAIATLAQTENKIQCQTLITKQ